MIISDLQFVENVTSEELNVEGGGKDYGKKDYYKKRFYYGLYKANADATADAAAFGPNAKATTSTSAFVSPGVAIANSESKASIGY
jgi:hypothetical protein